MFEKKNSIETNNPARFAFSSAKGVEIYLFLSYFI